MRQHHAEPVTPVRRIAQLAGFALTWPWLLVGLLRCPFGIPFLACFSCPLSDCPGRWLQIPFFGAAALSSLVAGRVFCGWLCPFGLISDGLAAIPFPEFGRTRRSTAPSPKFVALLVFGTMAALFFFPATERLHRYVVRTPELLNTESVSLAMSLGDPAHRVRLAALGIVLVLSLVFVRFWCRFLCPLGAILSIGNRLGMLHIGERAPEVDCACGTYPRQCPMRTTADTTDCIRCGECLQGCPQQQLIISRGHQSIPPAKEM